MGYKKSQLSLFLIVVVLLLFVLLFLYLFSTLANGSNNPFAKQDPENTFAESCLYKASQDAILILGLQNGIELIDYFEIDNYKINYAVKNNQSRFLSIEQMEAQLEDYIARKFEECISGYDNKASALLKIKDIKVDVSINRLDVTAQARADIQFKKGKNIVRVSELFLKQPVRLRKIQEIIKYVSLNAPYRVELYDYFGEQDLNVSVFNIYNETIYALVDDKSRIADRSYKYLFAIQ